MPLKELIEKYDLSADEIAFFAKSGAISGYSVEDTVSDEDLSRICLILLLKEAGLENSKIASFFRCERENANEQIRILRKLREKVLEGIHCKQRLLDKIDYLIYEINKKEGKK